VGSLFAIHQLNHFQPLRHFILFTNLFIGFVGLNTYSADLPFCPCVEIGWRLAFDHWGNGFATEAAIKCLSLGFSKFGLEEIVSFTTLGNYRSQHVMTKIGMVNTGNNFMHPAVPAESGIQEHCLFHILKASHSRNSRVGLTE